ncbi:MAG: o-succinylbenzoate synthase [Bacteroidales bacterium]|jgi:o-succinylbenzoate synthase|nr:o-succinylbenzoate synthase [Bacteroidota bacterium]
MFKIEIVPYTLKFKNPAGTSRGVYIDHKVWYIIFKNCNNPSHIGIGECAPLPDLSCDYSDEYEEQLKSFCKTVEEKQLVDSASLKNYPSILFGLETAMRHYQQQSWQLWDTRFSRGEEGIKINGLIWMGDFSEMKSRIEAALEKGFRCIKLKIGAIDFNKEIELLKYIRQQFTPEELELRVDANGGFSYHDVLVKLNQLAELNIHSIEQPIKAGLQKDMSYLCRNSLIPIALDEELIGINSYVEKKSLLTTINPQYIILKPSLHGGISGCEEWISIAEELGIGYWITSALESNIGLNSISQWCSTLNISIPQGLGTGSLYLNNTPLPLEIKGEYLWFDPEGSFPGINKIING